MLTPAQKLMYQGKLLSQMVAYIWRYGNDRGTEKGEAAYELKGCFDRTWRRMSYEEKRRMCLEPEEAYEIETLLTVDSRKFLIAKMEYDRGTLNEFSREQAHAAKLLIQVFGQDRVNARGGESEFLSPIFNPEEVDLNPQEDASASGYRFFINPDSFTGGLRNSNSEGNSTSHYMISYPPAPQISAVTLTSRDLEDWFNNTDGEIFRPRSPFIPVYT